MVKGIDSYCFTVMLQGLASWRQGRNETLVTRTDGAALRLRSVTRALLSDNNARRNLWIRADALERALERMLDDRLSRSRRPSADYVESRVVSSQLPDGARLLRFARSDIALILGGYPVRMMTFSPAVVLLTLGLLLAPASGVGAQPADCRPPDTVGSIPVYMDMAGRPGVPSGVSGQLSLQVPVPASGALACSDAGPPPADVLGGAPARDLLDGPGLGRGVVRRDGPRG